MSWKLDWLRLFLKGGTVLLIGLSCLPEPSAGALAGAVPVTDAPAATDVPYVFTLTGMPDDGPKALFDQTSILERLANKPLPSVFALNSRLNGDEAKARQILSAFGYFDGVVAGHVDQEVTPPKVKIVVKAGLRYRIGAIRVETLDGVRLGPALTPPPKTSPLRAGAFYKAQDVLDAEAEIVKVLGRKSYPFARIAHREVTANPVTKTVAVTWHVDRGPSARFGTVTFSGLGRTRETVAQSLIAWNAGAPVDLSLVEKTRRIFVATGLYRTVNLILGKPGADGLAPVRITLTEAPLRTVGAGLRYSTSDGIGVHGFWEHRNLFGEREDLKVEADIAETGYALRTKLAKPNFTWHNVDLLIQGVAQTQDLPAYNSTGAFLGTGLTWHVGADIDRLNPVADLSAVAVVQQDHVKLKGGVRDFTIVGLRLGAARSTANNPLEPTRGYRVAYQVAPYHSFGEEGATFFKTTLDGAVYVPLDKTGKRVVFAARAALGSLIGVGRDHVPPDYLFYAGGGASIRGFAYQYAGPVKGSTPQGGRSLATASAELRWYITDNIGIVPFIDIGSVYDSEVPDFSGKLYGGAGIGLRYRSPAGPLRLDVAMPVLGKRRIDSVVEIYISIGQAF